MKSKEDGMTLIVRGGHIVDPSQSLDCRGDIVFSGGKIVEVLTGAARTSTPADAPAQVIDASGLFVLPGLVDLHTHLREPGFEYKETIGTGTLAAVRGGFTSVCCMPNTNPVNDNEAVTEFILRKNYFEGSCFVFPIGAITKGQKGEELAEIGMMHAAGCVAFSDDGRPVMNSLVMRRVLEYSKVFGVPVIAHCEDLSLADGGVMNEGAMATSLGLRGVPAAAEEVMIARDVILAELTGGRLHIAHVSSAGAVQLIREAKRRGIRVTAETCPHYFSATEVAVDGYDTAGKVNPPLRTRKDVEAIKAGLKDGTIDAIATDHAPHHRDEKMQEFDKAPSGISGLETALGLSLGLVHDGTLTLAELVAKMTAVPSAIVNINKGTLRPGADADIVLVDAEKVWTVDPARFASKGKNTPFAGLTLKGRAVKTICRGRVYDHNEEM